MANASSKAPGTPAPPKNNPFDGKLPSRAVFAWVSSHHNSCLTLAAEAEYYADRPLNVLEGDILGLRLAAMYKVLVRELERELKKSSSEDEHAFALDCFAARLYRAGQIDGKHSQLNPDMGSE